LEPKEKRSKRESQEEWKKQETERRRLKERDEGWQSEAGSQSKMHRKKVKRLRGQKQALLRRFFRSTSKNENRKASTMPVFYLELADKALGGGTWCIS
jgi:hypothetical protein